MQMITSDKVGSRTLPVEVPPPLSFQTIIVAASKKFKTVSKQSRAYHSRTGEELTGPVAPEDLEGHHLILAPKSGWKGAAQLAETYASFAAATKEALEGAEAGDGGEEGAGDGGAEEDVEGDAEGFGRAPTHEELVQAAQNTNRVNGVVLFWRDTQTNGYLSNWKMSPFVIEGVQYNCCEQWIMACKARACGNDRILEKIMRDKRPKKQKALGRDLDRQLVAKVWRPPQKFEAQVHGARAKFEQNPRLALRLLRTGLKPMAEASPSDNIFGIGLAPSDPLAQDPANWKGTNILGRALMQVRTELRQKILGESAGEETVDRGSAAAAEQYGDLPDMDSREGDSDSEGDAASAAEEEQQDTFEDIKSEEEVPSHGSPSNGSPGRRLGRDQDIESEEQASGSGSPGNGSQQQQAAAAAAAGGSSSSRLGKDEQALEALIRKQQTEFPRIYKDLEKYGRKNGHWIWWACPTQMPGAADPIRSYVTEETAPRLFRAESVAEWRRVLEKICDLVDKDGMRVLPSIDHGRIHFFLKFWKVIPDKPEWMEFVLLRLDKRRWPKI